MIILGWHTEGLLRTSDMERAKQQDITWNLAAALGGAGESARSTFFQTFTMHKGRSILESPMAITGDNGLDIWDVPPAIPDEDYLYRVLKLVVFERLSGLVVPIECVGTFLALWTERLSFSYDPDSGHSLRFDKSTRLFDTAGVMQQRRLGLLNLQKAWVATKRTGYPSLEKARAAPAALPGRRIVVRFIEDGDKVRGKTVPLAETPTR